MQKFLVFSFVLIFLSSCGVYHISDPGKARYTNHKGRAISKERNHDYSASEKDLHNDEVGYKESVKYSKKRRRAGEVFFALWGIILLGSIALFLIALKLAWPLWATVGAGLLMGVVVFLSVMLIVWIVAFANAW